MLRTQIKMWFNEAIKLDKDAPRELKDSLLKGHPKLEGFIDNLTAQVLEAEKKCRQRGVQLKKKTIQDFVYDLTKYFMQGMEGEARRRYETDFQKAVRDAKINQEKEFDEVLAGNVSGEFAEAGIITNEKIDREREVGLEGL